MALYYYRWLSYILSFAGGFLLGELYCTYFLKDIPFPCSISFHWCSILSVLLGVGNAMSIQLRCISLLLLPMYCGKPGRGVLKAVVLIYVVAGPVTNMGLNAKEVVRVFACSNELSYNLSRTKYNLLAGSLKKALLRLNPEIAELKDTFRSVQKVIDPIQHEIEDMTEVQRIIIDNDYIDDILGEPHRSLENEKIYSMYLSDKEEELYQKTYLKKVQYRCEHQLSQGVYYCMKAFSLLYNICCDILSGDDFVIVCEPLRLPNVCNLTYLQDDSLCNSAQQIGPGLGEGYMYLKRVKKEFTKNLNFIKMQYKIQYSQNLYDIQDHKETGKRVMHAFEEKTLILQSVITVVNVCLAFLFLRILFAAQSYHDRYLTSIEFDNVYVTSYFKRIDVKRRKKEKNSLLPLKKMERNKYVDVHSLSYIPSERSKLLTQILKVMLEVVTATTFVMLDRLFYEALDVVRQHAGQEPQQVKGDIKIAVEGTGSVADMMRKVLEELKLTQSNQVNNVCLPNPRAMPTIYYFKIYGGYLWILILLYLNPYTLRLRRLICSYFYPHREKHRILHLYNDILKKRLKMQKTLRRKAVRTVRAHYLSGENLRSLRIRYPQVLGWLSVLPMARMQCLICGDTEPRKGPLFLEGWYSCISTKCPFVYCAECWRDAGARCLACNTNVAQLSDVDSITDDEPSRY